MNELTRMYWCCFLLFEAILVTWFGFGLFIGMGFYIPAFISAVFSIFIGFIYEKFEIKYYELKYKEEK